MNIGSKFSVRCYDGIIRTGKIVYIHPKHIFAVLEFKGLAGNWRESIMFCRSKRKPAKSKQPKHRNYRAYTLEEDKLILKSKNIAETSKQLGRCEPSVYRHRNILRRRFHAEQTRFKA